MNKFSLSILPLVVIFLVSFFCTRLVTQHQELEQLKKDNAILCDQIKNMEKE